MAYVLANSCFFAHPADIKQWHSFEIISNEPDDIGYLPIFGLQQLFSRAISLFRKLELERSWITATFCKPEKEKL